MLRGAPVDIENRRSDAGVLGGAAPRDHRSPPPRRSRRNPPQRRRSTSPAQRKPSSYPSRSHGLTIAAYGAAGGASILPGGAGGLISATIARDGRRDAQRSGGWDAAGPRDKTVHAGRKF